MTERPHCELQKYHYQAVRDSMEYRMQGLMDCRLEEMEVPLTTINETHTIETRWSNKQWDTINQLRREILFLSNKVNGYYKKGKRKDTI